MACADSFRGPYLFSRLVACAMTSAGDFHPELAGMYCGSGERCNMALEALHSILFEVDFEHAATVHLPLAIERGVFPLDWAVTKDVERSWPWCADSDDPVFTDPYRALERWEGYKYTWYNLVLVRTFFLENFANAWQDLRTPSLPDIEGAMFAYMGTSYAEAKKKDGSVLNAIPRPPPLHAWNTGWYKTKGPCSLFPGTRFGLTEDVIREMVAVLYEGKTSILARLRLGRLAERHSPLRSSLSELWASYATGAVGAHHVDSQDPYYKPDPLPEHLDLLSPAGRAICLLNRYGAVPRHPLYRPVGTYMPKRPFKMGPRDALEHDTLTEALDDAFATECNPPNEETEMKAAYVIESTTDIPAYTLKYGENRTGRARGSKDAEKEREAGEHYGAKTDLEWAGSQLVVAVLFCECMRIETREVWREELGRLRSLVHAPLLYCARSDAYKVWSDYDLQHKRTPGCPSSYPWRVYLLPNPLRAICSEQLPDPKGRMDHDLSGSTENPTRARLYSALYAFTKALPRTSWFRAFVEIATKMSTELKDMLYLLAGFLFCFLLGRMPSSQWAPPFQFAYSLYRTNEMTSDLCGCPDVTADVDWWMDFLLDPLPVEDDLGHIDNGMGGRCAPNAFVSADVARQTRDRRKYIAVHKKRLRSLEAREKASPPKLTKVFRLILYPLLMHHMEGSPNELCFIEQNTGYEFRSRVDACLDVMCQMTYRNHLLSGITPNPYTYEPIARAIEKKVKMSDEDLELLEGWVFVEHSRPVDLFDGLFEYTTGQLSRIRRLMFKPRVRVWERFQEAIDRTSRKAGEEDFGSLCALAVRSSKTEEEFRRKVVLLDVPLMNGPNFVSLELREYIRVFVVRAFRAHQVPSWFWLRAFPVRDLDGNLRVVRKDVISACIRAQEVVEFSQNSTIPPKFFARLAEVVYPWEWELIAAWVRAMRYFTACTLFPLNKKHRIQQDAAIANVDRNFRFQGHTLDPYGNWQCVAQVCPNCLCFLSELVTAYDNTAHSTITGPIGVRGVESPVTGCLTPGCRGILPVEWKSRVSRKKIHFGAPAEPGTRAQKTLKAAAAKAEKEWREALERKQCTHVFSGVSGGVVSFSLRGHVLILPDVNVLACPQCLRMFVYDKGKQSGDSMLCQHCVRSPLDGRPIKAKCFTCPKSFDLNGAKRAPTYWSWDEVYDEETETWEYVYLCSTCTRATRPMKRVRNRFVLRPYEGATKRTLQWIVKGAEANGPHKTKNKTYEKFMDIPEDPTGLARVKTNWGKRGDISMSTDIPHPVAALAVDEWNQIHGRVRPVPVGTRLAITNTVITEEHHELYESLHPAHSPR